MLHTHGYVQFPSHLNTAELLREYTESQSVSYTIFNYQQGKLDDEKRKQCNLDCRYKWVKSMMKAIQTAILPHTTLKVTRPCIITSDARCQQQHWHTDYDPKECGLPDDSAPLGLILAFESGTTLDIQPKESKTPIRLAIPVGDILLFRGDLIHAGSPYKKRNSRLHMYVEDAAFRRALNRTYLETSTILPSYRMKITR